MRHPFTDLHLFKFLPDLLLSPILELGRVRPLGRRDDLGVLQHTSVREMVDFRVT